MIDLASDVGSLPLYGSDSSLKLNKDSCDDGPGVKRTRTKADEMAQSK
jgi:hypothetical protein